MEDDDEPISADPALSVAFYYLPRFRKEKAKNRETRNLLETRS